MFKLLNQICYVLNNATGCVEGSLRLVGGATELEGAVEACVNGLWGYIGDGGWNDADAEVVCRQLGLPTGGIIIVHVHVLLQ